MDNSKNMETFEASSMPAETAGYITDVQDDSCSKNKTAVDIHNWLISYVAELLEIEPKEIDITIPLERYGLDSSEAVILSGDLQDWLECELDPELLLDYQTIEALTEYLIEAEILTADISSTPRQNKPKILPQKVDITVNYALSHGQKALWFLYKLAPQSHAYNVAFTARICSQVSVPTLKQAFQKLNDRHPMLRATFFEQDGEPRQKIKDRQEICFEEFDASAWSPDELKQQVIQAYQRPFDLERGPILRVSLFNCSDCDRVLLLSIHHIACDGWSIWLLLDELRVIYQGQIHEFESLLPTLEFSYLDYVNWQSEILANSEGEGLWHYWQQQLAGELPLLNLPTDRRHPPVQNYQGSSHSFNLSPELTQKLKELGQTEGTTTFMTLLAAFQVLLHRYTGQDDILVGSPMKCRSQTEWHKIFGYLVNPVVLRANLADNPSFSAFLAQVRQTVLNAIAHQDYPFPLLVERLQPERESSRSPLFQTMFVLQKPNKSGDILDLLAADESVRVNWGGLELESFEIPQQDGQFDLTLEMMETKDSIRGILKYDTDLFDAATIARMEGHFQVLLEGIVANPSQQIGHLPILTPSEEHQLLVEWNDTKTDYPQDKCIHQLFEEQVEKTPDAIALVFEDQQLTYRELNSRANQLAHYLQSLGVKPEVLVGICVERSVEMVVGLLGILKAGGAYVPIDPTYPQELITYMLNDSAVSVLLTTEDLAATLPQSKANLVSLDRDWSIISKNSQDNCPNRVDGQHLAYMIYTSGSTGKPKGAMNTHQAIRNRLLWMQDAYQLNGADKVLQKTPFSFDVSVWEFFWPLIAGACLIVAKPGGHKDSAYLVELIIEQQITTLHFVPSMLQVFVEEKGLEKCICLKRVICSGEALPVDLQTRFFERLECQLHNLYGPTEAAIDVTFWECQSKSHLAIVPIGRPIANTQIYILDSELKPMPVGVPGELHIGGVGLARGYYNRPELTAAKFIPNPFSNESDARLYKTGDLVRYLPDGNIEYLSRLDYQVKIRGFRIELGEIESALTQHPDIKETIVIAREEVDGNKNLLAYLVSKDQKPEISELRSFLSQRLPDYMIPTAFVVLDKMPLTPNGKIDRRALPTLDLTRLSKSNFIPPQTAAEESLVAIWSEILGLEQVSVNDNFFELGGDSIKAIRVIAKAKDRGINLSLQNIYQNQIISKLASVANYELDLLPKTENFSLISHEDRPKLPADIEDAYPLSRLQAGMIFHSDYSHDSPIYHDVFSYQFQCLFNFQALYQAIETLLDRHPVLRTSFHLSGFSEPLQLVHKKVPIPIHFEDISHLSNSEQERVIDTWIEAEKQLQFDWNCPPMLDFQIHLRTPETWNITLSFHHSILDGWSIASMLTELLQQYFFLMGKYSFPLNTLPGVKFRDFIALEKITLESEKYRKYWSDKLTDLNITKLPRWPQSYRSSQNNQLKILDIPISTEISDGLKSLAKLAEVPLKSVLLASHLRVINLLSNQKDVLTGLVTNGRLEETDAEKVLGLFLNTIPLRLELSGGTWIELVKETFRAEQDSLPYRRFPLAEIQRNFGGQQLFETTFNFIHFHVYQSIQQIEEIELLNSKFFEQTNFTFTANFSLDIFSSQINLRLSYDASELSDEQVKSIGNYYVHALTSMANKSSEQYQFDSLLSERELHQLLVEWNDTRVDYPQDKCIPQLFEEQVVKTPDAVAVVFEEEQLTYRELNNRANQLAHYLQKLGVEPEVLVGICVERSLEMVIGLLGILKAGGAYVPLDPTYPQERLAHMIEDSAISILLTQEKLVIELPEYIAQVVCLDIDWNSITREGEKNILHNVRPNNLAYLIYTSGSTGKPKGVMLPHQAIVNHMFWMQQTFPLIQTDKVLQKTPFSFDASIWEFYAPLLIGAQLVIAKPGGHQDSDYLIQVINQQQITVLQLVPSLLRILLGTGGLTTCQSLRRVFCGGEALSVELYHRFTQQNQATLLNLYGPTEACIDTHSYNCHEGIRQQNVPIGTPIANTQTYLLDHNLQPVPIGIPGELHIGGVGLARGYINRPALTEEKFISNPFSNELETRLYKTGDLARYLPDGNIEFIGRIDNQVKIRGFRIELREIEAVLSEHPNVRETVVIAREDQPGEKRLVTYLVTNSEPIEISQVRSFIAKELPDYMVPAAFVVLERMPLTPNGKIDRRALPLPDKSSLISSSTYEPPRTPTEELLVSIWREVLGLEQIGINDNFFELGGHSLLATQVISRIREIFSIKLSLSHLFKSATISELGKIIEAFKQNETEFKPTVIEPISRGADLALSFAQERLWFLDQLEGQTDTYNMPGAVKLTGNLNISVLEQTIAEISRRHEVLRTNLSVKMVYQVKLSLLRSRAIYQ